MGFDPEKIALFACPDLSLQAVTVVPEVVTVVGSAASSHREHPEMDVGMKLKDWIDAIYSSEDSSETQFAPL